MYKKIPILTILLIFSTLLLGSCSNNKKVAKVFKKKYRSVIVINKLNDPYIKECKLYTSEGAEISSKEKIDSENIIFENIDKESDMTTFKIILTDRFDLTYEKEFETNATGVTEVSIKETDREKRPKDILRLMNKKMNQLK